MLSKHKAHYTKQTTEHLPTFNLVVSRSQAALSAKEEDDYIPLNIKLSVLQKLLQCHALVATDFCCNNKDDHQCIRQLLLDCICPKAPTVGSN